MIIQRIEQKYPLKLDFSETTESYVEIISELHKIIDLVHNECAEYLNDESLCNNSENMFPRKDKLTGRYYIESIKMINKVDNNYEVWVMFNFTEIFMGKETDYLGLEIIIQVDEMGNFNIIGVNSFSI